MTAATSAATEVAEDLLSYFVDIGNKECFAAMLYACFDLLRPDVVEETSWQHGLNDFYMPYKIQISRTQREKVRSPPLMHSLCGVLTCVYVYSWPRSRRRWRSCRRRTRKRSS